MAYCSITAIYTALPKLPNTTTGEGFSICAKTINLHIRRADGRINGKCSRRYSVPFSVTPPYIRTLAEDIVSYYTYRSFFTSDNLNKSDYLEELKETAYADLDLIMNGDIDLVDTSGSAVPGITTELVDRVGSNTENYATYFDIDDSLDWDFDEDLKTEVKDGRS